MSNDTILTYDNQPLSEGDTVFQYPLEQLLIGLLNSPPDGLLTDS